MDASVWQATLTEFQTGVAAAQPTPAGVAVACVNATFALSLLIKVLRISGKCPELLEPARQLVEEIRATADADVAAIHIYIQTRDKAGLKEVPPRASHAISQAMNLCAEASAFVTGLLAADIAAATALLNGCAAAVTACIDANAK
jgi:formiminotetrahydrofolate cyclodeaminase